MSEKPAFSISTILQKKYRGLDRDFAVYLLYKMCFMSDVGFVWSKWRKKALKASFRVWIWTPIPNLMATKAAQRKVIKSFRI